MAEKLLILGGTGFIGSNLSHKAIENDFNTTVLSLNFPTKDKQVKGVKYLQADISNLDQLRESLSSYKFDYIVNLAGYIDHSLFLNGGRQIINTHFDGVQNLLQVLDWNYIKRFVQIGSSDEYGDQIAPQSEDVRESPISPYSSGKLFSTQLLQMLYRTEELPVVILRLFLVYGPGQNNKRFLPQIIEGCLLDSSFPASAGEQLRDFCYVDDISRGIIMSLKNDDVKGQVVNLASGKSISIREVVELVRNIVGHGNPEFGKIPYRVGENMALYADTTKAKKLLNWVPEINIEEGVRRTIFSQDSKSI